MRDHQKAEKRKKYEVNETLTSVVHQEDIQRGGYHCDHAAKIERAHSATSGMISAATAGLTAAGASRRSGLSESATHSREEETIFDEIRACDHPRLSRTRACLCHCNARCTKRRFRGMRFLQGPNNTQPGRELRLPRGHGARDNTKDHRAARQHAHPTRWSKHAASQGPGLRGFSGGAGRTHVLSAGDFSDGTGPGSDRSPRQDSPGRGKCHLTPKCQPQRQGPQTAAQTQTGSRRGARRPRRPRRPGPGQSGVPPANTHLRRPRLLGKPPTARRSGRAERRSGQGVRRTRNRPGTRPSALRSGTAPSNRPHRLALLLLA
ncbi:filaggrin-like [Oryctolagus cuniculus]|uniref:filaggrin-like n=1 Tax=Oryctolagus cuniculus TaxID=9986 RepID=UPI003879A02E